METNDEMRAFARQFHWISGALGAIAKGSELPPLPGPQIGMVGGLIKGIINLSEEHKKLVRQITEFKAKEMEYIESSIMDSKTIQDLSEREKKAREDKTHIEADLRVKESRVEELQNMIQTLRDHAHQLQEKFSLQEKKWVEELSSREEMLRGELSSQESRLREEMANREEISSHARDLKKKVLDISEQFEEERHAFQSIIKVGELMSISLQPEEVLKRACKIPLSFIGCKRSLAFLKNEKSGYFYPVHHLGFDPSIITSFKSTKLRESDVPLLDELASREKAILMEDCRKTPSHFKVQTEEGYFESLKSLSPLLPPSYVERFQIYSLLAIPFISRGTLSGILFVDYGLVRQKFSQTDVLAMDGLGKLIGTAMDNIAIHRETSQRLLNLERETRTVSALEEMEEAITSTNQTERMIETVIKMAPRVIGCEWVSVLLVDKHANGFYVLGNLGGMVYGKDIIPFEKTGFHGVLRADQILYRPNLENVKPLSELDLDLIKYGIGSDLLLPLSRDGEIMGIIHFSSRRVAGFTQEEIQIGQTIADCLGTGLKNSTEPRGIDRRRANGYYTIIRELIDTVSKPAFRLGDYRDQMIACGLEISRGMNLNEEQQEWIKYAIVLHDIGKTTIPPHILNKKDSLTEKERAILKSHPISGAEVLKNFRFSEIIQGIKFVKFVAPLTRHCYERWDGTGYPDGLEGEAIPPGSRILAVVNAYAAMLTDRPYRKALATDEAVREIKASAGTQFDPAVVELFLRHLKDTHQIPS